MYAYTIGLFVISAAAISASGLQNDLPFKTILEKAVADYKPTQASSFTIPSDQCSGLIDQSLLCGAGGVAGAVRVEVRERGAFAAVDVDRYLRNVSIVRAADARGRCPTPARVLLTVGCLVGDTQYARRKRHLLQPVHLQSSSGH